MPAGVLTSSVSPLGRTTRAPPPPDDTPPVAEPSDHIQVACSAPGSSLNRSSPPPSGSPPALLARTAGRRTWLWRCPRSRSMAGEWHPGWVRLGRPVPRALAGRRGLSRASRGQRWGGSAAWRTPLSWGGHLVVVTQPSSPSSSRGWRVASQPSVGQPLPSARAPGWRVDILWRPWPPRVALGPRARRGTRRPPVATPLRRIPERRGHIRWPRCVDGVHAGPRSVRLASAAVQCAGVPCVVDRHSVPRSEAGGPVWRPAAWRTGMPRHQSRRPWARRPWRRGSTATAPGSGFCVQRCSFCCGSPISPSRPPSVAPGTAPSSDPEPASVPRAGDTAAKLGQWKHFQNLQDRWEARRSNPKYLILWIIDFLQKFPAYLTISTIIWCAFSKVRIKPA